jgi:hypothetical protein
VLRSRDTELGLRRDGRRARALAGTGILRVRSTR